MYLLLAGLRPLSFLVDASTVTANPDNTIVGCYLWPFTGQSFHQIYKAIPCVDKPAYVASLTPPVETSVPLQNNIDEPF